MTQDPRGPIRQIISLDEQSYGTFAELSCGHVANLNQIFHYKLGEDCHCVRCIEDLGACYERNIARVIGDLP